MSAAAASSGSLLPLAHHQPPSTAASSSSSSAVSPHPSEMQIVRSELELVKLFETFAHSLSRNQTGGFTCWFRSRPPFYFKAVIGLYNAQTECGQASKQMECLFIRESINIPWEHGGTIDTFGSPSLKAVGQVYFRCPTSISAENNFNPAFIMRNAGRILDDITCAWYREPRIRRSGYTLARFRPAIIIVAIIAISIAVSLMLKKISSSI